jgi:hypothetical protein
MLGPKQLAKAELISAPGRRRARREVRLPGLARADAPRRRAGVAEAQRRWACRSSSRGRACAKAPSSSLCSRNSRVAPYAGGLM